MKSRVFHISLFLLLIWGVLGTFTPIPFSDNHVLALEGLVAQSPDTTVAARDEISPPADEAVSRGKDNAAQSVEPSVAVEKTDQVGSDDSRDTGYEADDDLASSDQENNNSSGLQIADPIEPFNRAMYHFNDKLYFWVLKPVATGYGKVVPEVVRVSVKNFFTNLAFPIRFVSSLLQADIKGAAQETGRFVINSIWGIAGFLDLASMEGANLPKQDSDLGQSMGLWGIGQGFYIVWPVFGPSSPRDTLGSVGESFLYPVSYLQPWYASTGVKSYETINDTSLKIGDYEALKGAAIDPYIAIRDAYVQYRYKKIEKKRLKLSQPPSPEQTESVK
jgi:phospholipid-binding lipoprotein MlaA